MHTIFRASIAASLAFCAAACTGGSTPPEALGESAADMTYLPAFSGYYQIDAATPLAGEITLVSFAPDGTFWAERCADDACDPAQALSGKYRRSKAHLRLYAADRTSIGVWAYQFDGDTLWLRGAGTDDAYALDPMTESLCDDSRGSWSDDELAAHGFNCTCPDGQDWGPGGCDGCPAGSCR